VNDIFSIVTIGFQQMVGIGVGFRTCSAISLFAILSLFTNVAKADWNWFVSYILLEGSAVGQQMKVNFVEACEQSYSNYQREIKANNSDPLNVNYHGHFFKTGRFCSNFATSGEEVPINLATARTCPGPEYNPNPDYTDIELFCPVYTSALGDNTCTPPKKFNTTIGGCDLPADDTKNPPDELCSSVGNPINFINGNKFTIETDFQALSESSLQFVRHHNSSYNYQAEITFGHPVENRTPLGFRWSHNYYQGLTVSTAEVKLTLNNGQTFKFNLVSDAWKPDADVNYRLQETLVAGIRTGWKVTTPDDTVETYNTVGDLLSITDPKGITQTLIYSCDTVSASCPVITPKAIAPYAGLLIQVTDNFNNSLKFTYDIGGHMTSMTNPTNLVTHYSYDDSDNLKVVTYPDATLSNPNDNPQKTYIYGNDSNELANTGNVSRPHALTGIIDENNIRYATYRYDANGKAISTEHATGGIEKYSLAYSPGGNATTVTDPLGSIRTTHLTTVLGVVKSTGTDQPGGSGCSAASSAITYDANGNVASRTDFNGHRTNYTHDLTRNLETSRTEGLTTAGTNTPQTRVVTTEWHPTFRLPTKITEPGLETSYSYDSKGNITSKGLKDLVTNKVKQWATSYTYSANGILVQKVEDGSRTDVSDTVTYDYYPEAAACTGGHLGCRGQLKQITDALGHTNRINRYTANGQPEVTIDPNGLTTTMAYDVRQRLISLDVGGELTTYTYDPAGLMTRVTQPNGAYLVYRYDNAHRLIEVKDQLGNTRTYTLDNMGNRVKEDLTDPNGQLARSQTKVYDALSRLQNLVLPQ
jgi:YD repeat-containing protein